LNVLNAKKHAFTIFTYSNGQKQIITGFPENKNMLTGNLEVIDTLYTEDNKRMFLNDYPEDGSYKTNKDYQVIMNIELDNDQQLSNHISKARKATRLIETVNNGGRFDYDICITDKCWGANSNTVQSAIYKAMNIEVKIPEGIDLPGIKGNFYNGPLDDFFKKLGEQLQQEQP
jgi:hypothetical protein